MAITHRTDGTLPIVCALVGLLCPLVLSARDVPVGKATYAGTLALDVDLKDPGQRIFRVHETIPVNADTLDLYYPKWIPGEHAPSGTLDSVTGLVIKANDGQRVEWRRDLQDMFTLHLTLPAGTKTLQIDFELLSAGSGGDFGQSISVTNRIEDLEWNQVVFYPAGYAARNIAVKASIKLPEDWGYATALRVESADHDAITFVPVSLEQLVDSPLISGLNFRRLDLAPGAPVPVHLDLVTDDPGQLKVSEVQLQAHRNLISEAAALFGAIHYEHYDFLFTLSEHTGHFGLEHSQSSDDRLYAKFFVDGDTYLAGGSLLPHEYVHSWNGKFRRPAGLATPHYNTPMLGDLLWVYEGLTEYYGDVLTARSGIWTADQYRDYLASIAASLDHRSGRSWRNLQDTADAAQLLYYSPADWASQRRSVDYYDEGELIWLEADAKIRELSAGRRSLDDFAHAFFGTDNGSFVVKPYQFDDVVKSLNRVQPYDWARFLRGRLDTHETPAPFGGITHSGWSVTYTDQPSEYFKARSKTNKILELAYSLGLTLSLAPEDNGHVIDVLWGSPAFTAGFTPRMTLLAVNGVKFDPDLIDEAIRNAQHDKKPIEFLVQNLDTYSTLKIDYVGGPQYPHLTRIDGTPDRMADIIAAKASMAGTGH